MKHVSPFIHLLEQTSQLGWFDRRDPEFQQSQENQIEEINGSL